MKDPGAAISKKDVIIAIAIFVTMLLLVRTVSALSARFTYDDWYLVDEGNILYTAYRSSVGELPHVGEQYFYSGGFEILLGIIFNLVGTTLAVARWTLGINMAATGSVLYLLCTKLSVDRAIAVGFSVLAVAMSYSMNFHCYPAWYAGTFLLIALLIVEESYRLAKLQTFLLVLAGACLGVASSLKQTAGLYALFAFILSGLTASSEDSNPSESQRMHPSGNAKVHLAVLAAAPIMIILFFILLIRARLSLLNLVMFLVTPTLMAAFSVRSVVLASRNPNKGERVVLHAKRFLMPMILGTGLGFLPLILTYVLTGFTTNFINDSFVNIQQAFANRYSEFKFVGEEATSNPFVFFRWLVLFILPVIIALVTFVVSIRKQRCGIRYRLLLLVSLLIALSYFTLYPIAIRMYVLYLMPLVIIPVAYLTDVTLKRFVPSSAIRLTVVVVLFSSAFLLYLGTRSLAGDLQKITARNVDILNEHRGNDFVPQQTIYYLQPVLEYIERRPKNESLVGLDAFNRLIAFVTERKTWFDYLQQRYSDDISSEDLVEVKTLLRNEDVDIIVFGKRHLRSESAAKQSLFDFLAKNYVLVLDNSTHLIYQRIPE